MSARTRSAAFASFVAALTAEDVLSAPERAAALRDMRRTNRDECYRAHMAAAAAAHTASATSKLASCARVMREPAADDLDARHEAACRDMIERTEEWFALAALTEDERACRRRHLRLAARALGGCPEEYADWSRRRVRWTASLTEARS